jgi:glycosyltransferase involved in cell wall biosynthesis
VSERDRKQLPRVQLVSKPGSRSTGIGRYAWEIERGLRDAGVDVRAARLTTPLPRIGQRAIRRLGYDVEAFTRSYPVRADVRPGWITHLTSQTLATLLLTQRLPRPVIVTVHDILPYVLRDDPELSTYRHRLDRTMDALAMRALKRADHLVAVSAFTRQALVDQLEIDTDRITVIPNGVDQDTFRKRNVPDDLFTRYDIPRHRPMLLHVGTEDPRKGLPLLLEAMALVVREAPDIVLVKAGDPAFTDLHARNVARCDQLGISDKVCWIGPVPEADLPALYSAAAALVFPSLYEGFGLPVLESLACGTPVVAFRAAAIPEIVDGSLPLVEEVTPEAFAAGIIMILESDAIDRARLTQRAAALSWSSCVDAISNVYAEIAAGFEPGQAAAASAPIQ